MFYLMFVFDVCYKLFLSGFETDGGGESLEAPGGEEAVWQRW